MEPKKLQNLGVFNFSKNRQYHWNTHRKSCESPELIRYVSPVAVRTAHNTRACMYQSRNWYQLIHIYMCVCVRAKIAWIPKRRESVQGIRIPGQIKCRGLGTCCPPASLVYVWFSASNWTDLRMLRGCKAFEWLYSFLNTTQYEHATTKVRKQSEIRYILKWLLFGNHSSTGAAGSRPLPRHRRRGGLPCILVRDCTVRRHARQLDCAWTLPMKW